MNRRLVVVGTAAVALASFAGGIVVYRNVTRRVLDEQLSSGAGTLIRAHSPVFGPKDAPVTIVEFFDPSCEACRAFYPIVKQILAMFPGKARLVLRYAPLHEGSDEVVKMLEAARLQGRFEPVLEALLARQSEWAVHGAPDLRRAWELAGAAGLDIPRARRDVASEAVVAVLNLDVADGRANDVQKTPTFVVNGRPLMNFGAQQLYELVRSEVERSEPRTGASGGQ